MRNHISIEIAREMLNGWVMAEKALMTSVEYQMGTRRLRRVDLKEVREAIKYWQDQIDIISGKPRNRMQQVIPRST